MSNLTMKYDEYGTSDLNFHVFEGLGPRSLGAIAL